MKRLVLILVGVVLIIGGGAVIFLKIKGDDKLAEDTTPKQVVVSGAERIADYFQLASVETLNRAVAAQVEKDTGSTDGNYEITYREGSYTKTTVADNYPLARVIIDIPQLERTYVVTSEGDSTTQYADLRVLCPTPADLKYKSQPCNDVP